MTQDGPSRLYNKRRRTGDIIDALVARALEAGWQGTDGTIYASTGGAFGLRTAAAISSLLPPGGDHLVAGVDRGAMGDTFAEQLRHVAAGARATFSRALPDKKDWAEDLHAITLQDLRQHEASASYAHDDALDFFELRRAKASSFGRSSRDRTQGLLIVRLPPTGTCTAPPKGTYPG